MKKESRANASCNFFEGTKMLLLLFMLLSFLQGFSQNKSTLTVPATSPQGQPAKITIEKANSLEGERMGGKDVKKLIGDVVLGHEGALMYCDSAIFYDAGNSADCYGKVRIVKGDSLQMTADFLRYDGNKRLARLVQHVRLTDSKMVLTTDTLDYDRNTDVAYYNYGAKIIDKENNLTSRKGSYFIKDKTLFFKSNVNLDNAKYLMKCDTLKYVTLTKIAYFYGPTRIYSKGKDSTFIYCENGWYNTVNDKSYFGRRAYIQSKEQQLKGDSLLYDKRNGIGEAFANVFITDTLQHISIQGDYGKFMEHENTSYVAGITTLTQAFEKDSMFLHADTLIATYDSISKNKTYLAYHHVKIFKTDLQGKCDSLVYNTADTLIKFYTEPILWSDKNQITAEFISLQLANNKIVQMNLKTTAFIVSEVDSVRYNQIKGKNMTGFFIDNKLKRIVVEGNGQTVYYPKSKNDKVMGANRAECSDLVILLDSNAIKKITLINKPEGTLFPIKDAPASDFLLKGFDWKIDLQPKRKEDIYLK